MLIIPTYIEQAHVCGLPAKFSTTNDDIDNIFDIQSPAVARVASISERAKLAFTAALVEWIVWRLDGLIKTEDMLNFAESLWAAVVDYDYTKSIDHDLFNDQPLQLILYNTWSTANAQLRLCKEGEGEGLYCVNLASMARYVMPKKTKSFAEWLKPVLVRLVKLYEWPDELQDEDVDWDEVDMELIHGPWVPRQVLDPNFDFDQKMTNGLINDFLQSLDYTKNPYLRTPEEMLHMGFKGIPYRV